MMCRVGIYLLSSLSLVGCGYTSPGNGSDTLQVVASAHYRVGRNPPMELRVDVHKDGSPIDNAEVVLISDDTGERIALDNHPNQDGRYRADLEGYHRRLTLRVDANADFLEARLEGPGAHTITSPGHGDRVRRSALSSFTAEWATADGVRADKIDVSIDRANCRTTIVDDNGKVRLPCSALEPGNQRVDVSRTNQVALAGGRTGSEFSITYTVSNTFVVED